MGVSRMRRCEDKAVTRTEDQDVVKRMGRTEKDEGRIWGEFVTRQESPIHCKAMRVEVWMKAGI